MYKENPKIDNDITVVMATYNGELYIAKQLESIISQTCLPAEIVICDDCSSDATVRVIEKISAYSPIPIRLIRNDRNLGHSENFFKAVIFTKTRYIAFCDQDDIWHPEKIDLSMKAIRRDGSLMVVHNAVLIDKDDRQIGRMEQCQADACFPARSLDPWTIYFGLTQIVDRKIFSFLPFDPYSRGYDSNNPNAVCGHDAWTSFVATTFGSVTTLKADLVFYRQHGKNVYGFSKRSVWKKIILKITEEQSRTDRLAWLTELARFRHEKIQIRMSYVDAAEYWRRILDQCEARYGLAKEDKIFARIYMFISCLQNGVYRDTSHNGLGPKRLIEDFVMGVLRISFKQHKKDL